MKPSSYNPVIIIQISKKKILKKIEYLESMKSYHRMSYENYNIWNNIVSLIFFSSNTMEYNPKNRDVTVINIEIIL